MRTLIQFFVLVFVGTISPCIVSADTKGGAPIDISGKWAFIVETPQGPGSPTFVFEQKGETLTGTYTGYFGTAPLAGTVKEGKVNFTVKTQADGQEVTMVYAGEVSGEAMKGKIDFAGLGEATFTGKRAP
jgi:hypothetical protein